MSGEQRFSLVAFRFKSGYQDVYIHCKMTVCRSKEEGSKCAKGCQENENDSRKKREVKDEFVVNQFIGPIKVKGEEEKGMYYLQCTLKDLCQAPLIFTQRQFLENICSEDDLRSRIFGTLL